MFFEIEIILKTNLFFQLLKGTFVGSLNDFREDVNKACWFFPCFQERLRIAFNLEIVFFCSVFWCLTVSLNKPNKSGISSNLFQVSKLYNRFQVGHHFLQNFVCFN